MVKTINLEREVEEIEREYMNQTKILNKYWRVLMKRGFEIARKKGLEVHVLDYNFPQEMISEKPGITIYRKDDDVNIDELIDLTKEIHPGIYDFYQKRKVRHKKIGEYIDSLVEELEVYEKQSDVLN